CELGNELNGEKWAASRFLMDQLRQRDGGLRFTVKRIRYQLGQVFTGQGREYDFLQYRSTLSHRFELAHQRMACIDFVVPVGTDQHQVLHIRPGQQILHQVERRGIEPLQIVKEKGERMFRPREYADESTEHQLKAALRVLWGNFRDWGRFS